MASYCSQCGVATAVTDSFCPSCGKALPKAAAFGQPTVAAPPPVQTGVPAGSYGQPYGQPVAGPSHYDRGQQMSGFDWMLLPLKRYAEFSGRSRRQEYWMFFLLNWIVAVFCIVLIFAGFPWTELDNPDAGPSPVFVMGLGLLVLWWLGTLIPSIAVAVRRFHDQNQSGWLYLLCLIPYVGGIVLLVFMCLDGTPGPNRFGPDPKGRGAGDVFA
jgi:uncharacterized membrane protein YhaH (DUF805 family)